MKHIKFCLLAVPFALLACGPKELTRDKATEILSRQYPMPLNVKVPIDDEEFLRRADASDLEEEGWLKVETQSFIVRRRVIHFTEKSKPYLLRSSREDMEMHLRSVKMADTEFIEVTSIYLKDDDRSAEVEYTTRRINEKPFVQLFPEMPKVMKEKARFKLSDGGWKVENP